MRGSELVIAESWLQDAEAHDKKPAVTDLQKAFIREGRVLRDRLQQQVQKRQQIELRARITSWAIGAVIVTTSLAGFSVYQWRQADQNYKNARQALDKAQKALDIAQNYENALQALKAAQEAMQPVFAPDSASSTRTSALDLLGIAQPQTLSQDEIDSIQLHDFQLGDSLLQAPQQGELDTSQLDTSQLDTSQLDNSALQALPQGELDSIQSELDSIRKILGGERTR